MAILHFPEGTRRTTRRGANRFQGFALLQVREDQSLYVPLVCARRGHGSLLLETTLRYADSVLHASYLYLHALPHVVGFYRKHWFRHVMAYGIEDPGITTESREITRLSMWNLEEDTTIFRVHTEATK